MRCVRPKWPVAVVVRMAREQLAGHHWTSNLGWMQLGGTRAPYPFLSVTFSILGTTKRRFFMRGKARVIREVVAWPFPTRTA